MEGIRTEALQQFEELLIENEKKSECILIFEAAFVRMRNELEKERREKDMEKFQSENLNNRFEEKLLEVQEDILEFELFSDIGISALIEGIQWFRKSIETYEQKKKSQSRIDRVQLDAARLLSTVHNQIRANIQLCNFAGDEYEHFQKLAKSLEDSIHIMNSKISICSQNVVNINYNEMVENMNEVGQHADDLLIFLKNIQEKQRKTIDNKLKFNTNEEKCKLIMENAKFENAKEVEKVVGKSVEKFVKLNRNKSNITLEDVRRIIVEVNGLWKRSYDQEVETHRNGLKNMFVEFERQLAEWKTQKSPKKDENRKINEWKGPIVPVVKQVNSSEYTGIIRQTVFDITKLNMTGEYTEYVMIGGLKWKTNICVHFDDSERLCFLSCEEENDEYDGDEEDSEWQCTALCDFRVMDRLKTKPCHSSRKMEHFNAKNRTSVFTIKLEDLFEWRKDVEKDDTLHVEVEFVVLAASGVPRLDTFKNSDYKHVFGTFAHTFWNISVLSDECLESAPFNISGFQWVLSISNFYDDLKVSVVCSRKDGRDKNWSCKAKVEFRLLKHSKSGKFYSKHEAGELNRTNRILTDLRFIEMKELRNVENGYITNDGITIEADITIFEEIVS